jgi:hypothetical protein
VMRRSEVSFRPFERFALCNCPVKPQLLLGYTRRCLACALDTRGALGLMATSRPTKRNEQKASPFCRSWLRPAHAETKNPRQFPAGGPLRSSSDNRDQKFRWTRKLTEAVPTLPYCQVASGPPTTGNDELVVPEAIPVMLVFR